MDYVTKENLLRAGVIIAGAYIIYELYETHKENEKPPKPANRHLEYIRNKPVLLLKDEMKKLPMGTDIYQFKAAQKSLYRDLADHDDNGQAVQGGARKVYHLDSNNPPVVIRNLED